MIERLHYFGATHRTAAIAAREKLAQGPQRLPCLLAAFRQLADEAIVLNTCGRFEMYLVSSESGPRNWPDVIAPVLGVSVESARSHLHAMTGRDVARHALRVAAGLDSRLLGEDQILSQVRAAFALAMCHRSGGPMLSALFRAAIHTGRRVRGETALGRRCQSFARLAVGTALDWLHAQITSSTQPVIVVLGTGTLARDVAEQLRQESAARLIFVSRHSDRARALAAEYHGEAHGVDALPHLLRGADVCIACATTTRPLITAESLPAGGPGLLIDLGVPRNIEAAAGGLPGVKLIHLDMLRDAEPLQDEAVHDAERIVSDELTRYVCWLAGRAAAPRIVQLLGQKSMPPGEAARERRRSLHASIMRLKEEAAA